MGEDVPLPDMPTDMKQYTDYRIYGIEGTPHNRLRNSSYTDIDGMRRFGSDYIVAIGSFYSTDIGDRFEVELDSGNVFTVIVGDGKADVDTDINNMYAPCTNYNGEMCANVLEFIVDTDTLPEKVISYGSVSHFEYLAGDIERMTYLGRDTSADWETYC